MTVRVHGMAWALEDLSKGLLLLSSELRWHLDRDLDKQIAELGFAPSSHLTCTRVV